MLIDPVAFFRRIFFQLEDGGFHGEQGRWLRIKHEHWKYEEEWRYIREDDIGDRTYMDIEFPPEALTEIIAGYRTPAADFECLRYRAERINPDIRCFKMSPHESEFRLVKSPLP